MIDRYRNRFIKVNQSSLYDSIFEPRGINKVEQYTTPIFSYPSDEVLSQIETQDYEWKVGDKLYKLAAQFYGDPRDWWIILRFNQLGSESNIKVGDVIKIPLNIQGLVFNLI